MLRTRYTRFQPELPFNRRCETVTASGQKQQKIFAGGMADDVTLALNRARRTALHGEARSCLRLPLGLRRSAVGYMASAPDQYGNVFAQSPFPNAHTVAISPQHREAHLWKPESFSGRFSSVLFGPLHLGNRRCACIASAVKT